ncbi:mannitol dehydrogenase family protein [Sphingopyxis kveilinensis]|uniref:mannitol dehydrogenase family protein n=1 Tax=Sphingopyxis kveilinensis TaxID=3114367 RepID=UPI0030D43300
MDGRKWGRDVEIVGPAYNRKDLTPGIVHIGVGNFHRAHMAVYLDELFSRQVDHDWGIVGAGVRPADAAMREALEKQDYLSTVIELSPGKNLVRRVGAMVDFVAVDPFNAPLIEAMSRPEIRIVSLTVTEGGYFIDPATGRFDPCAPGIAVGSRFPGRPVTAFGAIVAALRNRRAAGIPAFTLLSCDNLPGNGHAARDATLGLARLSQPGLADWIETNVAFPNSMVDRIAPATGDRERQMAIDAGIAGDSVPVICEPYRQWVLEDRFPSGRPSIETVGAVFTDRVEAFETMKIRILNGGHAIIGYAAALCGIDHIHDAMASPTIAHFVERVQTTEILPIVPPPPGHDLARYKAQVIDRFRNHRIADTSRRLCFDGSNRQPKFILPSVRDNLEAGRVPHGLILATALWCRYCYGTDDNGCEIAPNDPDWAALQRTAKVARRNPDRWIAMRHIYGDLSDNNMFRSAFGDTLDLIWSEGAHGAIRHYNAR